VTKEGWCHNGKQKNGIGLLVAFACLVWSAAAFADFSGKVVAIKDGDTLEILTNWVAVRVGLYGIDCPEKGQVIGQKAKQFKVQTVTSIRQGLSEGDFPSLGEMNEGMNQNKKRPTRYKIPKEGLFIPPIKSKRISPNSYPVMEEVIFSGFPK
jgi:hypothetical protein